MRHLITLMLCATAGSLSAQLQNGGFETLDTAGMPTFWTAGIELFPIGDSVVVDSAKYLLNTTDVHSGSNATELRNAYNYTQDFGMPGRWMASSQEQGYGGFPSSEVPVAQRPEVLHFWAKYAPVAGDTGYAEAVVLDQFLLPIGEGILLIPGPVGSYTQFDVPITYSSADSAAFITVRFITMVPGGNAHLGTRMLIDDVSIDYATTGIAEADAAAFKLFPNPAGDEVRLNGGGPVGSVRVLDAMGREALMLATLTDRLYVGDLRPGTYLVETLQAGQLRRSRLVVAR